MRIIYFDMDCTRPDHLGAYGYERETSPVIDELAKSSVVFESCYTSDAPCLPSRASLFSCRPGISNGVVSHEWPGCNFRFPGRQGMATYYDDYTMPMRLFQENGYHTITFSVFAQRHSAWWFNAGFSEVSNPINPCTHENSNTINPRVTKWIKDNIKEKENLFMHINYWDAHTMYNPDDDCRDRVSKHPLPKFPDEELINKHYNEVYGPKTARDIMIRRKPDYKSPNLKYMPNEIENREDFRKMMDSYDGSIATIDKAIGEIIEVLKEEGVYENTIIIISGDHGEAIGQLGMYFEHGLAVDSVAKVPLIIHWPGITDKGIRCKKLIYQYDFMATIFDMLDMRLPSQWEAKSFAPLLRGEKIEGREYLVFGCGIFSLQRAVRTNDYCYVKTFHPGCLPLDDEYLFDMNEDSEQSLDIKDKRRDVVGNMENLYSKWWNSWCSGPDAVVDPMYNQITNFEYFPVDEMYERLNYLGRNDQIDDLKNRQKQTRKKCDLTTVPYSRF